MFKPNLAIALLTLAPLSAAAYETGNLTCENIGQFAGQTLTARQSGVPKEIYLSLLNERLPGSAQLERKLVANITTIIYQSDLLAAMEPADAYVVFRHDCLSALAEDGMRGQEEQNDDTTGEQDEEDETVGKLRTYEENALSASCQTKLGECRAGSWSGGSAQQSARQ
jgi:hypothetical protein